MIKSITHKVSVRIAAGAVGVAMVVSGLSFALPAAAAGLTASQIQSILSLLQSFGADQGTINNVNAALNGQATTGTTGGTTMTGGSCPALTRDLQQGSTGSDVMALQKFLNSSASTQVAASGAGSPGMETSSFGPATKAAVIKFQTANNVSPAAGYVGAKTRAAIASVCGGTTSSTGGTTTTTTTTGTAAGTATVVAAAQPANAIAPANAARVPFTAFTVTAGGAPVTINSVTVQRQGPSLDTDFSGVVLVDASTGVQLGTARILDANHNATIGTPITIPAGSSKTFWVAGNIASAPGSGDVASFAVTAVNTASTVSGALPISGASNTLNSSLTIGTATITNSSFDPAVAGTQPVGTTGYRFTGIRVQAGSAEDVTFKSITWYQSGSASGIQNVMTVVNGTSYPTTVDSTGRYYTTVFPTGIVIPKGQQVDVYVQGDLGANTVANTYAEFDVYRNTDIYIVGNTYGYGITPTDGVGTGAYSPSNSHNTIFNNAGATATPWIQGSTLAVTAGQFSTIQNATSVGAQNIAVNTPNQPLGGFQTNLTGEAIQVQSLAVTFTASQAMGLLQNVSLVNESGQVVAGPYNSTGSGTSQTVTFTGAINFPTGTHTYTLQGQVQSTTSNGTTIQASTNPSAWTNVTGQTTGNTITIGVSTFTMNTMTVQAASLVVSNGTTPVSQTIVAGGQNIAFETVQLDASQSGENVRLSSIPMVLYTSDTLSKLSNCQLWNGTTALNTGSYVVNGSNAAASSTPWATSFNFNNSLTVPKGTVMNLSLTCSLSSTATGYYRWAVSSSTTSWANLATGATSGASISGTTIGNGIGGSAPTMTTASGATLAISTDPTSPAYALVAGGSTGVTLNVLKFHATNESVNLQKLGLQLTNQASSSASDLTNIYIYAGNNVMTTAGAAITPGTLLGTMVFTAGNFTGTSTLSTIAQLPVNADATLVIKADVANIGTNQPGTEGHLVAVDYNNSQGVGASSGATNNSGAGQFTGSNSAGIRTFRTVATVAAGPTAPTSPNGTSQVLKKFSVTAGSQGGIGLDKITFSIATSTGVTLQNIKLYAFTDTGYSQPANVPGTTGGLFGAKLTDLSTSATSVVFQQSANSNSPLEVGAGQTIYFSLVSDVTVSGQSTWSVNATLKGDTAYPSLGGPNFVAPVGTTSLAASNFLWSPNATTTVPSTANDWTNGYSIPGLPSTGF